MFDLVCHPDSPTSAVTGITVWANRKDSNWLSLRFSALGDMAQVAWPATEEPDRWSSADGLWQRSCFEFFAAVPGSSRYVEVNLASSHEWAAYSFDDYRSGMTPLESMILEQGDWQIEDRRVQLKAVIRMPSEMRSTDLRLGLSAVIEQTDGTKSYWALAHPPGQPDFHHSTCFAAMLAAPDAA